MSFLKDLNWSCDIPREKIVKIAAILSVSVGTVYVIRNAQQTLNRNSKVEKKRSDCASAKSNLRKHLQEVKVDVTHAAEITSLSFEDLRKKLSKEELDPVKVIRAFQYKALEVDSRLNCIIEPVKEAEVWASDCKPGPLQGIPISLKDVVPIQGYDATLGGCVNMIGFTHPVDAAFIKVLKDKGAVPFMITNAPQALLSFSCVNPVFGSTKNPHDPGRTPGGSSGGEAALIGAGGSILGVGTDLGGSIRLPAAFSGICALKPTNERFSTLGFFPITQRVVEPSTGPLAREVDALVEFIRVVTAPDLQKLDPALAPIPFREQIYFGSRSLRIGYYCDDGYYPSIPACQRGVNLVKDLLEKQGHTLVPFQIPDVGYAIEEIGMAAIFGDEGRMLKTIFELGFIACNASSVKEYSLLNKASLKLFNVAHQLRTGDVVSRDAIIPLNILWYPRWLRKIRIWFDAMWDKPRSKLLASTLGKRSVSEWLTLTGAAQMYRTRVIQEWQKGSIDCVICPVSSCVAFPDGIASKLGPFFSYTFIYNVLNFPAGVVPVSRVNKDDMEKLKHYPADTDGQRVLKQAMGGSEGLPVGVQCVALPFQEELVLRLMKSIESGLKERVEPCTLSTDTGSFNYVLPTDADIKTQ